ncbi:radical SAM/SPASM domain-containing protein, partial [Candidatus Zixiibacteriota bacterium]
MSSTASWRRAFILCRRILTAPITIHQLVNICQVLLSYLVSSLLRRPVVWGYPFLLEVEPSSLCNLRCPLCAVGAGNMTREQGNMPLDQYRRIIDDIGPYLVHLTLWNQGEPFLNPDLLEMIRYAKARNMVVLTSTNGHFLNASDKAEKLVASGLDDLIISIDGVNAATYQKYRIGGDFQRVLSGIRHLVAAKKRLSSAVPYIELQFLIMRHNQNEIESFRSLAKELGVDRISLKTLQVKTPDEARRYLPDQHSYRRYKWDGRSLRIKGKIRNNCRWIWFCPVINSDGTVCACCFDKDNSLPMGNVCDSQRLTQIWHGERYRAFRQQILSSRKQLLLCQNCSEGL